MAKTSLKLPDDFIAIDLETTGLDAKLCEIIEIGYAVVENGEIVRTFSTLVKPKRPIPPFISAYTGITNEMVADAASIEEVLPPLFAILNCNTVVGQNVCFDDRFIQAAACSLDISFSYTLVDTMRMSRHVNKSLSSHNLDSIAAACGIVIDNGCQRHRALDDAVITAHCALAMGPSIIDLYGENPDTTVKQRSKNPNLCDTRPTVDVIDESNPFYGSNILFTGKLSNMTRTEAWQKTVNLGAVPLKGFSKKVDYLVVGSFDFLSNLKGDTTDKLRKAQKAVSEGSQLQIVSESFFLDFASEV